MYYSIVFRAAVFCYLTLFFSFCLIAATGVFILNRLAVFVKLISLDLTYILKKSKQSNSNYLIYLFIRAISLYLQFPD